MTVPFMRAYTELLVQTCHRRGAHAIGGMAAFIPNRRDPEVTETALAKVRDDKERESRRRVRRDLGRPSRPRAGRDGGLRRRPRATARTRRIGCATRWPSRPTQLLDFTVAGGAVTEAGVRANIRVALAYLDSWLRGVGAAAIDNLMEDAATAEISRSQLWLWITQGVALDDGSTFDARALRGDPRRGAGAARRGRGGPPARRPPTCSTAWSSTTTSRTS